MTSATTESEKDPGRRTSYRLAVLSRIGAAAFGGYAFATVFSMLLSQILPMPKAHAVLTGVLVSFAIYTCAILWAFSVKTAARAWYGLVIATAVCDMLWWMTVP